MLELADAMQRRPSVHQLGSLHHVAAVCLVVDTHAVAQRVFAVDIFGNVFGNVARCRAAPPIDGFKINAGIHLPKGSVVGRRPKTGFGLHIGQQRLNARHMTAMLNSTAALGGLNQFSLLDGGSLGFKVI